jgi:protein-L-isoaspartate(D-aspartate) O-methyltransferase
MGRLPRDRFVPPGLQAKAWEDLSLPIGAGQTISQPSTVARSLELLELSGHERVLEVGTGSGYQAALLSLLARRVVTLEVIAPHAASARKRIEALGLSNVLVLVSDGGKGWPDEAPYDAIVSAAAADEVPAPLLAQLADGGRLVAPIVEADGQRLVSVRREGAKLVRRLGPPCSFVPLRGVHGLSEEVRR